MIPCAIICRLCETSIAFIYPIIIAIGMASPTASAYPRLKRTGCFAQSQCHRLSIGQSGLCDKITRVNTSIVWVISVREPGLRIHQRGLSPITLFHSSYAPGPIYHRFPSVLRSPHSRVQVFIVRRFLPHAHTPNCEDNIARSLSNCDRNENDSIVVIPMLINCM